MTWGWWRLCAGWWNASRTATNRSFSSNVHGAAYPLPSEVETTLFRIAQEGLNNAIKHAQADHIWVTLDYDDGVSLTVRDDGSGFDPDAAMSPEQYSHLVGADRYSGAFHT